MPSILKLRHIAIGDISESLFLGGTTLSEQTDTTFTTQSGDYTLHFWGDGLTYDASGALTGGTINEFRVYYQGLGIDDQLVIISSNFTLLTGADLTQALALHAAGDVAGANALVMASWLDEYLSQSDYSDDDLHGYSGNEFLSSSGQNTTVSGLEGNDTIMVGWPGGTGYGGEGNDALYANIGNDSLYGGAGNDILRTDGGPDLSSDLLSGDDGNDLITGRVGQDTLLGGAGNDTLVGSMSYGGDGRDILFGVLSRQSDDNLSGDNGSDRLNGFEGADTLAGGRGNDVLYGGRHNDQLDGGDGDDRLLAGIGTNTLTGGAGHDIFLFAPRASQDRITDFELGTDEIWITRFRFANQAEVNAVLSDTGSGDALFQFGNGQTLLVEGVSAANLLADIVF